MASYDFTTEIIAASMRNAIYVKMAAMSGSDIADSLNNAPRTITQAWEWDGGNRPTNINRWDIYREATAICAGYSFTI